MNSQPSESSPISNRVSWGTLLRLGGTLLTAALVIYLLAKHWSEIKEAIRQIPGWLFLVVLGLMILSRLAVVGRWHVLLQAARVPISLAQSARITFAGLFANNFLPTTIGGDVARLAGTVWQGYDQAICLASLVVDRLVGMTGMALILPFGLPGLLKTLPGTGGFPRFVGGMWLAAFLPRQHWWQRWLDRAAHLVKRLGQALALWKDRPQSLLFALGFTLLHMVCFIVIMRLVLNSMGESISTWLIAGLWSITYFVTQLPVSINGWGVQELSMTFLFTRVGGVSTQGSLALALLLRVLQMIASLPGALFIPRVISRERPSE